MTRPTRRPRPAAEPLDDRTAPAVFTVTTTADLAPNDAPAPGSFRAALIAANGTPDPDDIAFNIPGTGPQVITLNRALPQIQFPVRIDGYTQPGAARNTLAVGDNAAVRVQIDFRGPGGLETTRAEASGTVIEGLSLLGMGIEFKDPLLVNRVNDVTIRGNFIGLQADGSPDPLARPFDLVVFGTRTRIGGPNPGDRNVIAGPGPAATQGRGIDLTEANDALVQNNYVGVRPDGRTPAGHAAEGIRINGGAAGQILDNVIAANSGVGLLLDGTGFTVRGNRVGTDPGGTLDLGNRAGGITLSGSGHRVLENVIAFNNAAARADGDGVYVNANATGNTITRNSIFSNGGRGITINGVSGAGNHGLPAPTLTSVSRTATGLAVAGTLAGAPGNGSFTVEVFADAAADSSGFGEGQKFLGTTTVTTVANGTGAFSGEIAADPGGFTVFTATVTNPGTGDTSEFSKGAELGTSPPAPPGNTRPTISDIPDVTLPRAPFPAVTVSFTIGDNETPGNLTLSWSSSNSAVIGITSFGGTGANRTAEVRDTHVGFGDADITVTVTDAGGLTASDTFRVHDPFHDPIQGVVGYRQFAAGADRGGGAVQFYNPDAGLRSAAEPFGDFTGGVRTAAADFTGDGVADLVVGTGPGRATRVVVLDGADQRQLFAVDPFEASFTGGVYVAAGDLTGDGKPEVVVTPDEGGGPRARVFNGDGFGVVADFFGIEDPNFRGGARAAVGDVNADGAGDLVVAAGFQGGPRVAGFDGKSLGSGAPAHIFGDFFAFEQTLRNGVFIAAGDLDGDSYAEVIAGGGPGGGPRVTAFSGKGLLSNTYDARANFFGGNPANRGGVRIAVKDLDSDTRADLVVGSGTGAGSRVTGYLGKNIAPQGTPPAQFDFDAFPGFTGGVFVG